MSQKDKTVSVTYKGNDYNSYSNEYSGNVVIPESVTYSGATYSVTSISYGAFYGCTGLTSIEIPNSVTSIGLYAFSGCTGLTSIEIPNSVTSIDYEAFSRCTGLTSIQIPNSVTNIGSSAFYNCTGLTSIEIPNSVTSIGSSAFSGCTGVTSIEIPNSVMSISSSAFSSCDGLTSIVVATGNSIYDSRNNCNAIIKTSTNTLIAGCKNTIIPNSVTSIGEYAFRNCKGLTSIEIPNSVTSIGEYSFCFCTGLTSISIPNSVTSIGDGAFSYCYKLSSIIIPNGVPNISKELFAGCSNLSNVSIPSSVTSIEEYAFRNCISLTNIVLPENISYIGHYPFRGCTSLSYINIPNSVERVDDYAFADCTGTIYIDLDTITTSLGTAINNSDFDKIILGDKVTCINNNTFCNNEKIRMIVIGQNVSCIGSEAFKDCTNLCRVLSQSNQIYVRKNSNDNGYVSYYATVVYNGNIEIKDGFIIGGNDEWKTLFGYIGNNRIITIPPVKTIEDYAFYEGESKEPIKTLIVSNEVSYIGNNLFRVQPIKTFWLTNSLPQGYSNACGIINYASSNNFTTLPNVYIYPYLSSMFEVKGVKYVPTNLTERVCDAVDYSYGTIDSVLSLNKTVTYKNISLTINRINPYFADEAKNLKFIELDGISSIGDNAFNKCSQSRIVKLSNIRSIGKYAFSSCGAETLELNEIDSIFDYGFSNCSRLQSINIPASLSYISYNSFSSCSGLNKIIVASDNMKYDSRLECNAIIETSTNKLIKGCHTTIIPNDIIEIGDNALSGCNLTNLTIPESVIDIGKGAFSYCSNLNEITFPKTLRHIGENTFRNCKSISELFIPYSVMSIGNEAFFYCESLKRIILEKKETEETATSIIRVLDNWTRTSYNNYNSILYSMKVEAGDVLKFDYILGGKNAKLTIKLNTEEIINATGNNGTVASSYEKKFSKAQIVNFRVTYNGINSNDFVEISNISLKSTIPYLYLGNKVFYGCPIDSIYLGRKIFYNSTKEDGFSPFYKNTYLRSVVISDNETAILDNEFYGCKNLKNVSIGDGVESIGKYAFSGCTSLETFIFGSNMKSIGQEAFSDCSAMKHLFSEAVVPPTCGSQALEDINKWECTLYVPNENIPQYQAADQWKDFFFVDANPFAGLQSYRITYMVDGEVYRVDSVEENSAIPAISLPSKEGYTFSGWEDIPAVMPNHDLVITGSFIKTTTTMNVIDGVEYTTSVLTTCDTLYYTRTFSNTNWQALYVPFSIPVDSLSAHGLQVAELNDTHQWDFDGDGVADSTRVEFFTLTSGSTEANYPYLIRATEPTTLSLTLKDIEIKAAEENSIECSSTKQKFTFVGTYTGVSGADMYNNNYYGMSGGGLKRVSNHTVSLKPQRWYMKIENKNGSPVNYFAPSIRFTVDGIDEEEEETSAIVDMCTESRNRHKAFYSLEGIRQDTAPTQRGMYVRQDKKLIIR